MDGLNPYAAPKDSTELPAGSHAHGDYRIEGDLLVVEKGASLPDICIYSGERGDSRVQRKLQWAPPWLAVVVVISPLIYLILYFIMRKTGEIDFALSPAARARRQTGIWVGVGGSILSLLLVFAGIAGESVGLAVLGGFGFLIAIIVGAVMANLVRVQKIDERYIYLKPKSAVLAAFARLH